jgi:two-component system CheB/CheR fusion protein
VPTELALHDAVQRLRAVVETAVDGIITIDERGIIDSVNLAGARMFGYHQHELVGRNVSMLMPQPYSREHDGYLRNYLRTGLAKIIGIGRELQGLRHDGTTFPMRLAVSEMSISGHRCFTGIVSDLTERRRLERLVMEAAAAEQRRIGQDLHDGLCQQLGSIGLSVERLKRRTEKGHPVDSAEFAKIQQWLAESTHQLRQVAHGLQPVHFRSGGLPQALRELAMETSERFHINCRVRCTAKVHVEEQMTADHLYRIAQEATGNAIKHGKATRVRIQLAQTPTGGLMLSVVDNGTGLAAGSGTGGGMGLRIMKYRADAIGADFRVEPRTRGGAMAVCILPPANR